MTTVGGGPVSTRESDHQGKSPHGGRKKNPSRGRISEALTRIWGRPAGTRTGHAPRRRAARNASPMAGCANSDAVKKGPPWTGYAGSEANPLPQVRGQLSPTSFNE